MNKMKNYIFIVFLLFLMGCNGGCWFSDGCIIRRNIKIIKKMTNEERKYAKQQCIRAVQNMIDITPNEKKQCNFWRCIAGKESFREDLRRCEVMYKNNKENTNE
jgi:hypothetical protein